jgi:hypothetical protein
VSTPAPSGATNSLIDALEPVRAELLRQARDEAAQRVREAAAAAEESVRQAEAEAARILAEARAEGAADAAAAAAAQQARSRRTARAAVLAARSEAYDELVRRSADALRDEPVERLVALAAALLGEPARVVPAEGGGVVATAGDRRVDLSLRALAERATQLLGPDAEGLWRP